MRGSSHKLIVKASVLAIAFVSTATSLAGTPNETAFLAENDAAIKKMMASMEIKPSGDAQAAVTGLEPQRPYVLALSIRPDGGGVLQPLAAFTTNPAGSAIVDALGPIRQLVRGEVEGPRRYLVIAPGTPDHHGAPVQIQAR